jgi:hypothetical protein
VHGCLPCAKNLEPSGLHSMSLLLAATANAPVMRWLESPSGGTMLLSAPTDVLSQRHIIRLNCIAEVRQQMLHATRGVEAV